MWAFLVTREAGAASRLREMEGEAERMDAEYFTLQRCRFCLTLPND